MNQYGCSKMKIYSSWDEALRANEMSELEIKIENAVRVYEDVLSSSRGRRVAAARTRKKIKLCGAIQAVDDLVSKPRDRVGFTKLAESGQVEKTFESIVEMHPAEFSALAQRQASERLMKFRSTHR